MKSRCAEICSKNHREMCSISLTYAKVTYEHAGLEIDCCRKARPKRICQVGAACSIWPQHVCIEVANLILNHPKREYPPHEIELSHVRYLGATNTAKISLSVMSRGELGCAVRAYRVGCETPVL